MAPYRNAHQVFASVFSRFRAARGSAEDLLFRFYQEQYRFRLNTSSLSMP